MRSIWKGHIRFSLVTIPIQIFTAIESKSKISFRQLHGADNGRIKYKKICASCDEEVPFGDIVKGYEYEPDQYVVLTKEEMNSVKLESTKAIDIEAFIDLNEVHPTRFETVYFIGPNGDVATKTFSLLLQTLKKSNKAGVGRVILRDKEDVVLITPQGEGLLMYKLRYPNELRKMENVPNLGSVEVDKKQMELAETLVDSLTTTFDKINFEDNYKDALMELVNSKVDGKEIVTIDADKKDKPVVDIMDALKASIEAAKKKTA